MIQYITIGVLGVAIIFLIIKLNKMSKELLISKAEAIKGGVNELKAIIERKNQELKDKQLEVDAAKQKLVDFERDEPEQITTITNLRAVLAAKVEELSTFTAEIDRLNSALALALNPEQIDRVNATLDNTMAVIEAAIALQ